MAQYDSMTKGELMPLLLDDLCVTMDEVLEVLAEGTVARQGAQ